MNQAITKMAPIQRRREKAESLVFVLFYRSHEGWQMGLRRSTLKDEVRYVCFLRWERAGNVIVI